MFYFSIKDPDGKLWCSTLLDAEGKHVGGKGYWGYCENFQYCNSNKRGKLNNEVQDFLKEELGILGNICLSIFNCNHYNVFLKSIIKRESMDIIIYRIL